MAGFDWGELTIVKRSTQDLLFVIYEDDGTTGVTLTATDQARFKMWITADAAPALDLSNSATVNGSSCTVTQTSSPAEVTVRLAQGDTGGLTGGGVYHALIGIVDDSETTPADAFKVCGIGKIRVKPSPTGDYDKA